MSVWSYTESEHTASLIDFNMTFKLIPKDNLKCNSVDMIYFWITIDVVSLWLILQAFGQNQELVLSS